MSCCAPGVELIGDNMAAGRAEEVRLASRDIGDGLRQTDLSVPGVHCGGCIQSIEKALNALPGVEAARVNLSSKRATIRWKDAATPPPFIETLRDIGYEAHLDDGTADRKDATLQELIRALAVAGFAASNIMLLSVSVWAGADAETRDLFHWLSALIALPALAYSGRVFFRSAWRVLRHGHTNMDVPISIGVCLAFGLSLYETVHHGQHAYFDASISLLFFLLIGRTLDHMMRERARTAVKGLARLASRGALVQRADGTRDYLPVNEIATGMVILLAAGERVPVDARVISGRSDIDRSLLTGESVPVPVGDGALLQAGTLNITGPLTIMATAVASESFLAEMMRLMDAAESGRSTYRRIADRAARLYAPVVHSVALLTAIGWMIVTGDAHRAITIAIAVLIITCPCALGLAVPMVQVVAARRLFERGILLKDGGALERLAEVDAVVFDKTGTLTLGQPRLLNPGTIDPAALEIAAAIAAHSRHPYSRALASARAVDPALVRTIDVSEHPGAGMEARIGEHTYRLGRAPWALASSMFAGDEAQAANVVLTRDGEWLASFAFEDRLRDGAHDAIAELARDGFSIEVLSGDRDDTVRRVAGGLGARHVADMSPSGKVARIAAIEAAGHKVLMVGDGLNDAPALGAAYASMAPASAADIGRNAADLVFLHESLRAVPQAIKIAREAARLVQQNLGLAIIYNIIAVPVAVMGQVTPLVAAVAMSSSSVVVIANALRLRGATRAERAAPARHVMMAQPIAGSR
ncbi:MAG: nitrogen fixation protein FixI [Rhizobiales bacterium 62-47]|nr:cadmium-translocating P-type ATPase [Hyphomicrobiales bacterium]OJY14025.1 MAG: nitrogen fixation protein FixI [Rhizobiales bacterium 62-47]